MIGSLAVLDCVVPILLFEVKDACEVGSKKSWGPVKTTSARGITSITLKPFLAYATSHFYITPNLDINQYNMNQFDTMQYWQ